MTDSSEKCENSFEMLNNLVKEYSKGDGDRTSPVRLYSNNLFEEDFIRNERSPNRSASKLNNLNMNFPEMREIRAISMMDLQDEIVNAEEMDNDTKKPTPNASIIDFPENEQSCDCPQNPYEDKVSLSNSLFFADGQRSVDFVLAYEKHFNPGTEKVNGEKRRHFLENLINQGLEVEIEDLNNEITFIKIHAPLDVLRRYSEILKFRMPMKEELCGIFNKQQRLRGIKKAANYISEKIPGFSNVRNTTKNLYSQLKGIGASIFRLIFVDENCFPTRSQRFTAIYSRDKEYLFDSQQNTFFTSAVRSRVVQFILDRQKFSEDNSDGFAFGIDRLVSEGVYIAAYPLHDGEISRPGSMRYVLYNEWASVRKFYRYQPLDYIKEYFGVKIGLYFAWLGYYTYMLLLASIVGSICFLYSWFTLDKYILVKDICSSSANMTMCPLCDKCDFWNIKETCFYSKITYLIDNPSTVFFAVFMSFWATLFLELWKRYSAEITHRWDLTGFDVHEEHPRPQYLARLAHVRKTRIDYVTNTKEPRAPFWRMKLPGTVFSFSVVLLLVALAFAAVIGVVIYRMCILTINVNFFEETMSTSQKMMLTTASAACINLCTIFLLNYIYTYLAEYLTELELWRTQTEFDDSLTLKIYLFQFVNYYASIFYIAFFKGKFIGHPGQYNRIFNYRQEECSSGGCLTELTIQLAIIMVGKQAMNTILEMIIPIFWKWVNMMRVGIFKKNRHSGNYKGKGERWFKDLKLVEWGPRSLFPEYLEMVLQYGFVTIFVSAFPLAPIFALFNNILEMRLDAKKLLTYYRRPVTQRVKNIGVWYRILDSIGKLSVITNGFIIAFTSDFIPKLLYMYNESKDGTLDGYLDFSLSTFNISDSDTLRSLVGDTGTIKTCKYADFREPPGSAKQYFLSNTFYVILACRLAFVVVFENFVAVVMILVRWCIPDMSNDLRDQIRREAYITNEIIIKQETLRSQAERYIRNNSTTSRTIESAQPSSDGTKLEPFKYSNNLSQSEMDLLIYGAENTNDFLSNDEKTKDV